MSWNLLHYNIPSEPLASAASMIPLDLTKHVSSYQRGSVRDWFGRGVCLLFLLFESHTRGESKADGFGAKLVS